MKFFNLSYGSLKALLLVVLCSLGGLSHAQASDTAASKILYIQQAQVMTMTEQGVLLLGDILIQNGRILAVAEDLSSHPLAVGAEVLNLAGKTISPGLILPWSPVGISGWPYYENQRGSSVYQAALVASSRFDGRADSVENARNHGVTTVVATPLRKGSLFSGVASVHSLSPNLIDSGYSALSNQAMLIARFDEYPGGAASALDALKEAFIEADRYVRNTLNIERGGNFISEYRRSDLRRLAKVLSRELPLMVISHDAQSMQAVLDYAETKKISLILGGGEQAGRLTSQLARRGIPVVLSTGSRIPSFISGYEHARLPLTLYRAGVRTLIGSDSYDAASIIKLAAAKAQAIGLSSQEVMKMLTVDAAELLGLPDRGQLSVGKVADLVVWSRNPLDATSKVEVVYFAGEPYFPETRDSLLGRKYLNN